MHRSVAEPGLRKSFRGQTLLILYSPVHGTTDCSRTTGLLTTDYETTDHETTDYGDTGNRGNGDEPTTDV
jgi:hypothetical protein